MDDNVVAVGVVIVIHHIESVLDVLLEPEVLVMVGHGRLVSDGEDQSRGAHVVPIRHGVDHLVDTPALGGVEHSPVVRGDLHVAQRWARHVRYGEGVVVQVQDPSASIGDVVEQAGLECPVLALADHVRDVHSLGRDVQHVHGDGGGGGHLAIGDGVVERLLAGEAVWCEVA